MQTTLLKMLKTLPPVLLGLVLAFLVDTARADSFDLSTANSLNFQSGSDMYISFSAWNYAVYNRDSSPYPTSIGLQILGVQPTAASIMAVPHATNTYFSNHQVQAWLENTDGTVQTPFFNSDASRMGLASGTVLVQPGVFGSANAPVALIEASAALTANLSEQIFGSGIMSRGSSAVIHLRNLGNDLQIGLAGGSSVLSAVSEPSISGAGMVQTSGYTQSLTVTTIPEPGSLMLFLASSLLAGPVAVRWLKIPTMRR